MVDLLTDFPELTTIEAGIISKVYQDIFVWAGTIINGNGRYIQSWVNTIKRKSVIEVFINCPIVIFPY